MSAAKARRNPYRIFVSYAHRDRWIAKQIVRLIEETCGGDVHVFFAERAIEIGENIEGKIIAAIRECDEFVLLLSANSKERMWVVFEIGAARMAKKTMIAVLHDIDPGSMPEMIYMFKAVDIDEFESAYLPELHTRTKKRENKRGGTDEHV